MNKLRAILGIASIGFSVALTVNGCAGDDTSSSDMLDASAETGATGCTPGAKECVGPTAARVCPADGSGWLPLACNSGEVCDQGECKADANATCTDAMNTCSDDHTALHCRANKKGFDVVQCPANTACQGKGDCVGACTVGQGSCTSDRSAVRTCTDGTQTVETACPAGQACVNVDANHAACKPAACNPNCSDTCGNKLDATADQTKFVTICTETPTGFHQVAVQCAAGQSCNPSGALCGGSLIAGCFGDCTPGTQRCSSDLLGTQVCDANGKWGAVTACNASLSAVSLVCQVKPGTTDQVLCGDPICALGKGTCTASGEFRACGADGKLAATSTACTSGLCQATGNSFGGLTVGACVDQCASGAERCVGNNTTTYQTCANGKWSQPAACPATDGASPFCSQYTSPTTGLSAKLCGAECTPGSTSCDMLDGSSGVKVCDANGKWGPVTACTVGICTGVGSGGAGCVAECIPNSVVCSGSNGYSGVPGTPFSAYKAFNTCTAQGTYPDQASDTDCTGGTFCRTGTTGLALTVGNNACIECVGPNIAGGNEAGMTDTRCSNATGDAGGSESVETCSASNTWVGGALLDCATSGLSCTGATNTGYTTDTCEAKDDPNYPYYDNGQPERTAYPWLRTQSYYASHSPGGGAPRPQDGCRTTDKDVGDLGPPVSCGVTPDCCENACNHGSRPAACVP